MRQQGIDTRHGIDDVGARLFVDQQEDPVVAILPGSKLRILGPVDRDANIAYAHRRAVLVGDDDVVPGGGFEELIVVVDRETVSRAVDRAFGRIDRRRRDYTCQIFELNTERRNLCRIHLYAHRGFLLSADRYLRDPGQSGDLLRDDVLGVVVHRGEGQDIRMHRQNEDRRVSRVHLAVGRRRRQVFGNCPPAASIADWIS